MKHIGISQRVLFDKATGETRDALDQRWYDFISILNIRLYPIPNNISGVLEYIDSLKLDGFIFSGGNNVGSRNKVIMDNKTILKDDVSTKRENTEIEMLTWALYNKKPVIGVCRGMQFINSYFNGEQALVDKSVHVNKKHCVDFINNDFLKIYGKSHIVNSYHNYGIKKNMLSKKLIPTAIFENEIESFKHINKPLWGIMWHPERNIEFDECDIKLFNSILILNEKF